MRTVVGRIKANFLNPGTENSRVLARTKVGRPVNSTRKEEVVRLQRRFFYPRRGRFARGFGDLKLNWATGLLLHHDRSTRDAITMANVANTEFHQITGAERAINSQVK